MTTSVSDGHDETRLVDYVTANPVNRLVLERLPDLGIPDAWLVSGAVFQTIWNGLTGRPPEYGIADYDVFYFDPDLSWGAEDRVISAAGSLFRDVRAEVQIRNQARVHLWYETKFGRPYPPLRSATDGLTRFLAPACMIGTRQSATGVLEFCAPCGYGDILGMIVRPNASDNFTEARYREKAQRWKSNWPELRVLYSGT